MSNDVTTESIQTIQDGEAEFLMRKDNELVFLRGKEQVKLYFGASHVTINNLVRGGKYIITLVDGKYKIKPVIQNGLRTK